MERIQETKTHTTKIQKIFLDKFYLSIENLFLLAVLSILFFFCILLISSFPFYSSSTRKIIKSYS